MSSTRTKGTETSRSTVDMASARAKIFHKRRRIRALQLSPGAVQKRHKIGPSLPDKVKDKSHPVDDPLVSLRIH
jgi:hypothetical protein